MKFVFALWCKLFAGTVSIGMANGFALILAVLLSQHPHAAHRPRQHVPCPTLIDSTNRAICTLRRAGILPWRGR